MPFSNPGSIIDKTRAIRHDDSFNEEAQLLLLKLTELSILEEISIDQFINLLLNKCRVLFEVSSISYWVFSSDGSFIECIDSAQSNTPSRLGLKVMKDEVPSYFEAIIKEHIIIAENTFDDPRTKEFGDDYLCKNNVKSLFDAQVVCNNQLRGIICLEHCDYRQWHQNEQFFLLGLVSVLASAVLNNERLQQNVELLEFSSNLKTIHNLATYKSEDLEEIYQMYLAKGCQMYNLSLGIIGKINSNHYSVLATLNNTEDISINKGDVFELQNTYCEQVIKNARTISFNHGGRDPIFSQHRAYRNFRLETYIGAPLWVNGKIFGTISFSSLSIRKNKFETRDKELLELMANDLGRRIENHLANEEKVIAKEQLLDALKSLESNKERISNLVNTIDGMVWEISPQSSTYHFVSEKTLDLFGYPAEFWTSTPGFWNEHIHPDDRKEVLAYHERKVKEGKNHIVNYRFKKADGTYIWVRDIVTVINKDDKPVNLMGLMIDVTSLVKKEQKLQQTLKEKDSLFKELHHRVKNNLTMVINLFHIKSRTTTDKNLLSFIKDTSNRILAISKTHEQLIKLEEFNLLNSKEYIEALLKNLIASYASNGAMYPLDLQIEDHKLDIDTILTLGFFINEIITNSIKYAYEPSIGGPIAVSFLKEQGKFLLTIKDEGKGLQGVKSSQSVGMELINLFGEQLNGTIEIDQNKGLAYKLSFPGTHN